MLELIRCEFQRVFYYRKGAVFLLLFVIIKLAGTALSDVPANRRMEEERPAYTQYLERLSGSLTADKEGWLAGEAEAQAGAAGTVQTAYARFYEGEITEAQLHEYVDPSLELLERRGGFDTVYGQFLYVRQAPENRYFLYTNGWNALLSGGPDYFVILALFLLLAPVYCEDEKSRMDLLTVTMKRGGIRLSRCRLLVSAVLVLSLSVLSAALETAFCSFKYGLPNGDFPLQSIPYFGSCDLTLTLFRAAFLVFGLRTLGYLSLGVMILFCTVFFRKYAPSLMVCIAAAVLPVWGLPPALLYSVPGPAALLAAGGFLTALFSAGLVLAIQRRCAGRWSRPRHGWTSRAPCFLLAGVMLLSLTGCAPERKEEKGVYNLTDAGRCETERYLVYTVNDEEGNPTLTAEDKTSGARTRLVRDPFQASGHTLDCIYADGSRVYYIQMTADNSETVMYVMYDRLLVKEVDMTDFSERTIFRADLNEKNLLGGAFAAEQSDLAFYLNTLGFFVDEQYIYFIASDNISRVQRLTGKREKLIEAPVITDAAYDGEWLYYLDERSRLVRYNVRESTGITVPEVIAGRFYLHDGTLYFLNRRERNAVYAWDPVTGAVTSLGDGTPVPPAGDDMRMPEEDALESVRP